MGRTRQTYKKPTPISTRWSNLRKNLAGDQSRKVKKDARGKKLKPRITEQDRIDQSLYRQTIERQKRQEEESAELKRQYESGEITEYDIEREGLIIPGVNDVPADIPPQGGDVNFKQPSQQKLISDQQDALTKRTIASNEKMAHYLRLANQEGASLTYANAADTDLNLNYGGVSYNKHYNDMGKFNTDTSFYNPILNAEKESVGDPNINKDSQGNTQAITNPTGANPATRTKEDIDFLTKSNNAAVKSGAWEGREDELLALRDKHQSGEWRKSPEERNAARLEKKVSFSKDAGTGTNYFNPKK